MTDFWIAVFGAFGGPILACLGIWISDWECKYRVNRKYDEPRKIKDITVASNAIAKRRGIKR